MSFKRFIQKRFATPLLGLLFAFLSLFQFSITPVAALDASSSHANISSSSAIGESNITTRTSQVSAIANNSSSLHQFAIASHPSLLSTSLQHFAISIEDPDNTPSDGEETNDENANDKDSNSDGDSKTCFDQIGVLGWIVCPTTGLVAKAIDAIYSAINDLLVVKPLTADNDSPIYIIWSYARNFANIAFIILLLVVIYSQVTGLGITNYGIKRTLPRIIIAAILVNLSFIICSLAVDASNVIGASLRGIFTSVEEAAVANGTVNSAAYVSWSDLLTATAVGGTIGSIAIGAAGGILPVFLALIPILLGALFAVVVGFIMLAVRQAAVLLLVIIAPLAFVAYLLPNTEKYFSKWIQYLQQMLIFYPMFSLLIGASQLAGWALITSASNAFGIILGMAVQIFPLILAFSLMKLSGTILGRIGQAFNSLANRATNGVRSITQPIADAKRAEQLKNNMTRSIRNNPLNALNGGYWRARLYQSNAKRQAAMKTDLDTIDRLSQERINAAKLGQRIIGYSDTGRPIYSSRPVGYNGLFGTSNTKDLQRELENREVKLRGEAKQLEMENAMGSITTYLDTNNIKNKAAQAAAHRQGENFLELYTQQTAKKLNERADERFRFEQVQKAMERDAQGNLIRPSDYEKLVVRAAGADYHAQGVNAEKIKNDALTSVMAGAYDTQEKLRKITTDQYSTYFSKQVTKELLNQYDLMLRNNNIDGIVAAQTNLAFRGDYDKIGERLSKYMDAGHVLLGTDEANVLALNLLKMKDADPTLGRLGKHINMETWAYTNGDRKQAKVTMREFFTGEVVDDDGTIETRKTKINIASGLQGTSFKNIDRTAFSDLINLSQHYLYKDGQPTYPDMVQLLDDALRPQIVSAAPTFGSGSEQIVNTAAWLTGLNVDSNGKWSSRKRKSKTDDPRHDVSDEFFVRRTASYLKAFTPNDLINLKTDVFNAAISLFTEFYGSEDAAKDEFRKIFTDQQFGQTAGFSKPQYGNNNIFKLQNSDPSVLAPMKDSVRKVLGL